MSCNYADGLSPYEDKGTLGIPERFECHEKVAEKVAIIAEWIRKAKHVVFHTGAGISTSAGIPDFRGPSGVWTLEKKGLKPQINISFDEARPTFTHMAIAMMIRNKLAHYVISQNIDGLHLKSGIDRANLSELHGNMFIGQCNLCSRQFVRHKAVTTVGQKNLDVPCPATKGGKLPCRGKLHDTILDWEHELPSRDLSLADLHSNAADLSICLGTTLQIVPSGTLPLAAKRNGGKLVICNLQPTKYDKKADVVINTYVDDFMRLLLKALGLEPIPYDTKLDPTRQESAGDDLWNCGFTQLEWTIWNRAVSQTKKKLEHKRKPCGEVDDKPKKKQKPTVKRKASQTNGDIKLEDVKIKTEDLAERTETTEVD